MAAVGAGCLRRAAVRAARAGTRREFLRHRRHVFERRLGNRHRLAAEGIRPARGSGDRDQGVFPGVRADASRSPHGAAGAVEAEPAGPVAQAHPARGRRFAHAPGHRLHRPVPDPPLGLCDADRGNHGSAARRGEGRQGALSRRLQHMGAAVRARSRWRRSMAGRRSCRCRTTTTWCTAKKSAR